MNTIKNWLLKRKAESDKCKFGQGFDWAAGALLRGDMTPAHIEALTYNSTHPFDKGAEKAVDLLVAKLCITDNRTAP